MAEASNFPNGCQAAVQYKVVGWPASRRVRDLFPPIVPTSFPSQSSTHASGRCSPDPSGKAERRPSGGQERAQARKPCSRPSRAFASHPSRGCQVGISTRGDAGAARHQAGGSAWSARNTGATPASATVNCLASLTMRWRATRRWKHGF